MRPGHWPVVKTEYGFDYAAQFIRQKYWTHASAIRAAPVLESLQIYAESIIELRHRPGQDHGPAPTVLLHDGETMRAGKFLDRSKIGSVGTKLALKILTAEMADALLPARNLPDMLAQRVGASAAQQHADFQSLGRIGLTDRYCPRQRLAIASLEWMTGHVGAPSNNPNDTLSGNHPFETVKSS
jgi:hypothetical protein